MNFEMRNQEYREYVEGYLKDIYPRFQSEPQKPLFAAMEYSLLAGGKRLRPIFALDSAGCAAVTGRPQHPLPQPLK